MASEQLPLDINSVPALAHLVDEVERTGRARVLARNNRPIAVLVPTTSVRRSRSLRPPRDGLAVVERTAGIFRDAAKRPPPTIAEETDAFEQAVADEVVHGAGG
jgi:antitoxin (DNA-binding transcriptional repressor) of toxin-antitoxin stability system